MLLSMLFLALAFPSTASTREVPATASTREFPAWDSPTATPFVPECSFHWQPFLELQNAHAVHFTSTDAFDRFEGVGLGRDMDVQGLGTYLAANTTQADQLLPEGLLHVGSCATTQGQDEWLTQRVGPFRSTGGYDWWHIGWYDVDHVGGLLDRSAPGTPIGITAHWSGFLNDAGVPVGLPPLHAHHMHVTAGDAE
jgi:hypothetical protein